MCGCVGEDVMCGTACLPDVDLGEGGVAAQCVDDHRRLCAEFGISDG